MQTLLVALGGIVAAGKAALVARDRVLVRLDAAVGRGAERAQLGVVLLAESRPRLFPAQRQVRGRHNLDEVHVVEVDLVGLLVGAVERVQVVVGPGEVIGAELLVQGVGQLGAEAEVVDDVGEGVLGRRVPVVLEVVHVHVAVAEAAAGGDVEVADDLVHAQAAFDAAALAALLVETLRVVFALALLDALAIAERPGGLGIRLLDLLAGVAASGLLRVAGGIRAVARAAVVGVEVESCLVRRMP